MHYNQGDIRKESEAALSELINQIRELANSVDASHLFIACAANMLLTTVEQATDILHGPTSAEVELLAYYLYPQFNQPVSRNITPWDTRSCIEYVKQIFNARSTSRILRGFEEEQTPVDVLIEQVRAQAETVRGSAYPEQTSVEISEVQGRFEQWFVHEVGIGPKRAQAILWAVGEASEQTINKIMPSIQSQAGEFRDYWIELQRKLPNQRNDEQSTLLELIPNEEAALSFGFVHALNTLTPEELPVSRTSLLGDGPTEQEWEALIELIGLTIKSRQEMTEPVEVRMRPLYVLPDGRVFLADISNALDALWDQFDTRARKSSSFYERYQRHKARWLEERVAGYLRRIFPSHLVYRNLAYPDPDGDPKSVAQLDLAVKWGPFLVLVEAKAGQFRMESQLGDVGRLRTDLKSNVEDAFEQAQRAARYVASVDRPEFNEIEASRRLSFSNREIRKTYMLTVSLHHLAGLATQLATLQDIGLFQDGQYPLAISIADLEMVTEFCAGPDVFLHYIQKRLEIEHNTLHVHADELDLFGAYLDTRLQAARLWEREDADVNFVMLDGWSDDFHNWMMFKRGELDAPPSIKLDIPKEIEAVIEELRSRTDYAARWIAFTLLDLSDDCLAFIASSLRDLRNAQLSPGFYRRVVHQEDDTVISIMAALDQPPDALQQRTEMRAVIEKYRRKAFRSIGLGIMVLDKANPFYNATYVEGPWEHAPDIEALIANEPPVKLAPGQKAPPRNSPCICGSGKKFKKCCGRPKQIVHN